MDKCYLCGMYIGRGYKSDDHVIPHSLLKGVPHQLKLPTHTYCNRLKSNSLHVPLNRESKVGGFYQYLSNEDFQHVQDFFFKYSSILLDDCMRGNRKTIAQEIIRFQTEYLVSHSEEIY